MNQATIGDLRERLTLEAPERSADSGGGATITWVAISGVWARILPTGGGEKIVADGVRERITHEIIMRYRPDVNATMRLTGSERIFLIKAAIDMGERKRWMKCLCEERLP